jgi:LPXTG-site transpeptidase (sortase) family protein
MQKRPVLLSSVNTGRLYEKPRLTVGRVFLAAAFSFFVLYGVFDVTTRAFSSESSQAALITDTQDAMEFINPATRTGSTVGSLMPLIPERVQIPSLHINASVEEVGQNGGGHMAAPKHFDTVAWYKLGSRPGDAGNAIIAGHLNNSLGLSGVFEQLSTIQLGSEIIVSGEGREIRYIVREMHVYGANDAPASAIFSASGPSRLILITCDGAWDAGVRSYDKRLVVVAEPL